MPADSVGEGHAFGSSEAQASSDAELPPPYAADSTTAGVHVSSDTKIASASVTESHSEQFSEVDSPEQQPADSTTTEYEHKLPGHPIGFENLVVSGDQQELQASVGSPDSQASVHSVVQCVGENGQHEPGEAAASPVNSENAEVTSTEEKPTKGPFVIGFGGENGMEHMSEEQPNDYVFHDAPHEQEKPGEGGHPDTSGTAEMQPTNGIHTSGLSGSVSPNSPTGEYPNGHVHEHFKEGGFPELPTHPKGLSGEVPNAFDNSAPWPVQQNTDADQQHTTPYPLQSHDELFPKFVHMDPNEPNKEIDDPSAGFIPHGDGNGTHTFDPTKNWGEPEGLPAPIVPGSRVRPATTSGARSASRPGTGSVGNAHGGFSALRTATAKKSIEKVHVPTTLPPGPPVYLDLAWVPTYLVRVPHELATEFFARVRARIYVLSGEALHPMIGEALIEGKAKWGPNDANILFKTHNAGSDSVPTDATITVLPTDEPYDWGCWLRTPCGRPDHLTGEQRLESTGFRVLPSASCQDIEFSADTQTIHCEGVRLEF
jgi:hypothetical protein